MSGSEDMVDELILNPEEAQAMLDSLTRPARVSKPLRDALVANRENLE